MKNNLARLTGLGFLLFTSVFLTGRTYSQELDFIVLESSEDWQKATAESKLSGKEIFLDIYATWCGPCKMMDANVYTQALVADYFNANFVNVKVDGESEFGSVLASKYNLTAFPSMYFINSEETLINALIGYLDAEALFDAGKIVKEHGKRFLELDNLYASSSLSAEEKEEYIQILAEFGKKDQLAALAGDIVKSFSEADILNPANKSLVVAVPEDFRTFIVQTVLKNAIALKEIWGANDLNQYLASCFDISMQNAAESSDVAVMEKLAAELVPVYMMDNADRIPEAQLTTRKIYYSEVENWDNYVLAVEKYFNEFQKENLRFLYLESYYIIENQLFESTLLNKSNEWLEKVIAVQPDFESYFLAAIVNTYREDNDSAEKWMKMAESVAVTQDEKDSLEELKSYLLEL